jgi:hypothetical protein
MTRRFLAHLNYFTDQIVIFGSELATVGEIKDA